MSSPESKNPILVQPQSPASVYSVSLGSERLMSIWSRSYANSSIMCNLHTGVERHDSLVIKMLQGTISYSGLCLGMRVCFTYMHMSLGEVCVGCLCERPL